MKIVITPQVAMISIYMVLLLTSHFPSSNATDAVKCIRQEKRIVLKGLSAGARIDIYDLSGRIITSHQSLDEQAEYALTEPAVIKVYSGGKKYSFKSPR